MKKYVAFYKPYGVLSQFTGEKGDRTLAEFGLPANVYAAGRLDKDSEGLLLLTDDGPFIKKISDPKFEKEKTYLVQVEKIPTEIDLDKLRKGVKIKDYTSRPAKVKLLALDFFIEERDPPIRKRESIPTCWLEIKISEGKNRQVRRMTAAIGFPTLRLVRIQIGKLHIGNLSPGKFKLVEKRDII